MESFSIDGSHPLLESRGGLSTGAGFLRGKGNILCSWVKLFLYYVLGLSAVVIVLLGAKTFLTRHHTTKYKASIISDKSNIEDGVDSLLLPGSSLSQELQDSHIERLRKRPDLDATMEFYDGTQVVWQIPRKPSGVLFIAHGCYQEPSMFWDRNSNCTKCSGRPEHRNLTLSALRKGFAVIAVKSQAKCWSSVWPPQKSVDVVNAAQIVTTWRSQHILNSLPLFALGVSSGGYFVTVLAHKLQFNSIAVYISSGVKSALVHSLPNQEKYPATLFVHMPKDNKTASQVVTSVKILQKKGVQTAELVCREIPLSPTYFSLQINGLNVSLSQKVYDALNVDGFLDNNGFLVSNPRSSNWRQSLWEHKALQIEPKWVRMRMEKAISDELNVAFGYHELTSQKISETLDWFRNRCLVKGRYRRGRCKLFIEI